MDIWFTGSWYVACQEEYLITQGHTHKRQPTNQMSKHSSHLSSPHHLSTHRLLPNVSLVPEEVCLHGPLSWHRPRLPTSRMSIPNLHSDHLALVALGSPPPPLKAQEAKAARSSMYNHAKHRQVLIKAGQVDHDPAS